jgi:hypothetical protein
MLELPEDLETPIGNRTAYGEAAGAGRRLAGAISVAGWYDSSTPPRAWLGALPLLKGPETRGAYTMTFGVPRDVLARICKGSLHELDVVVPDIWPAETGFAFHEAADSEPPYQPIGFVPTMNVVVVEQVAQTAVARVRGGTIVRIEWVACSLLG